MATATPTIPDAAGLKARLGALRARMRFVAAWRGAAWLSVVLLGSLLVGGLVDWLVPLYALARALILVGALAVAGVVAWRCLIEPLSQPTDDLSLALRIEERHPMLNDALASTVQFLDQDKIPDGESEGMRREAVRRAMGRAAGLDFNRIVDSRGVKRATVAGGIMGGIALLLVLVAPTYASTAFWRLAAPYSSAQWPRKTFIELDDLPSRVGRNREYRITGSISGDVPRGGEAEVWFEGMPGARRTFAVKADEEGRERFLVHLKPEEVQKSFRFRVRAGDAETDERSVEVLSLPQFAALDGKLSPQVALEPPAYTGLPSPQHLSPGQGAFEAMAGTQVTVRGAADRPLKAAWITFETERPEGLAALRLAALAAPDPFGAVGTVLLGETVAQRVPATLSEDGKRFTASFVPPLHGLYTIHIEDRIGLENHRQYEMRRRMDPPPVVKLEKPAPASVLPDAVLPLHVIVEDTQFAARTAWLEVRVGADGAPRTIPLFHHADGLAEEAGAWLGSHARAAPARRLRLPRVEVAKLFPLRRVRRADGSPLKEGDSVLL
ncbi:MAG: hypothetical protein K2W96_25220, partial [Gemmataceae bacterium]|nr:hypothetical protein [Gemmataceae bacterium]